jgi:hypothetical protein
MRQGVHGTGLALDGDLDVPLVHADVLSGNGGGNDIRALDPFNMADGLANSRSPHGSVAYLGVAPD